MDANIAKCRSFGEVAAATSPKDDNRCSLAEDDMHTFRSG